MGRLDHIGIEKIGVYPTRLSLDLSVLARERGYDIEHMHHELMVYERGLNPPWEDPVTMAVNAAKPILSEEDIASIGLLIVGTETGLDQEKSLSSWVFHYLSLPSSCRHFEIKMACYSGTAALKMAAAWLASGFARPGQKALVITSDQSLLAIGKPWEYVCGAGATALLVSGKPDFFEIELDKFGIYSHEVADVIRPLPWVETGNSEHSLFSYMEALISSYEDYLEHTGTPDFNSFFNYNIYHVPFSGISFRAHKQLMNFNVDCSKEEMMDSFQRKTLPSLAYTKRIGGTYGGSVFITLLGLAAKAPEIKTGDRVGIFSYGSGSCAEYYSGIIGKKAREIAESAGLDKLLDERYKLSVQEYEVFDQLQETMRKSEDFIPDLGVLPGLFESHYQDKSLLVYKGTKKYYRTYEFS